MATAAPPRASAATRSDPARAEGPLDTTVRIVTPERIVFEYPLAGPFRRFFGYVVDMALLCVLVVAGFLISAILALGTASSIGPALVVFFALQWGYFAFCEAYFNGRTIGKRAVGVRVVSVEGVPITGAQAVLRSVVGSVDGILPFLYLPALASMVMTSKFQRLGDLAAGTMVVIEERRRRSGVIRVQEPQVVALLPWLPLRIAAGPELSRALSDYVKRRGRFSPSLREEMAAPLANVLRGRLGLPADAAADSVLCAVYHRVFLGE